MCLAILAACPQNVPKQLGAAIAAPPKDAGILDVFDDLPPILKQRFQTSKGRAELEQASRDKRALVAEARDRNIDQDPEIRKKVRQLEERLLIQKMVRDEEKKATVTDEDLRSYYQGHLNDYRQQPMIRFARIFYEGEDGTPKREKAKRKADLAARNLKRKATFDELAAKADGPERQRNGDMGFFPRGARKNAELVRAAFGIKDIKLPSEIIATRQGFSIIKVVEQRPARVRSFDEVRGEVENKVRMRKSRSAFDALVKKVRTRGRKNP